MNSCGKQLRSLSSIALYSLCWSCVLLVVYNLAITKLRQAGPRQDANQDLAEVAAEHENLSRALQVEADEFLGSMGSGLVPWNGLPPPLKV